MIRNIPENPLKVLLKQKMSKENIKEYMDKIYISFGINKSYKPADLDNWYDVKLTTTQKDGKVISAYVFNIIKEKEPHV